MKQIKKNNEIDLAIVGEMDKNIFTSPNPNLCYRGSVWTASQWLDAQIKDEIRLLYLDNTAVAFMCFSNIDTDLISLDKLAVLPAYQHRGFAGQLLQNLFSYAKKKFIKRIILEVAKNNQRAIDFYFQAGFKEIHIRKNYYPNGINALILECQLKKLL